MSKSVKIKYKGKDYYIDSTKYDDKMNIQFFLFTDPKLKSVAKVSGKSLMVKRNDINYTLKETMKKQRILEIIDEEIQKVKWGLITEEITKDDEFVIRDIIRKEVSSIFFTLFKKRKTWGA